MKTISRLIRRHVAAAFSIVLIVFLVNLMLFVGVVVYYGAQQSAAPRGLLRLSDAFVRTEQGIVPGEPLPDGFAWFMLLGHDGQVLWRHNLPAGLDHPYTVGQVAAFTRWYLHDYPIFVYRNDFGLLVAGMPKGSVTRFDFYMDSSILRAMLSGFFPLLLLDGALILACCLVLSWRASRGLRGAAQGIDLLADGQPVALPERGMAGELAEKLNRLSGRLAAQSAAIARRDSARTSWIAGVSHDIRTPLALILGYAEQLGADPAAAPAVRQQAGAIAAQAQQIRALIEDLNLTSKLQYDAQPLRAAPVPVGALVRGSVTDFLNSPLCAACRVDVDLPPEAGQTALCADGALLDRALRNLLANSAKHNPGGCAILVRAARCGEALTLSVCDDGCGYPPAVLRILRGGPEPPDAPHILGLHLVEQIARAHGASVAFSNEGGACCRLTFDTRPAPHYNGDIHHREVRP